MKFFILDISIEFHSMFWLRSRVFSPPPRGAGGDPDQPLFGVFQGCLGGSQRRIGLWNSGRPAKLLGMVIAE